MKSSLKDLDFNNLNFTKHVTNTGTIYNITQYVFQTPRVKIKSINENSIYLQILPTKASQIFFLKIHEFEQKLEEKFKKTVTPLFEQDTFKVKITNKNFKVYLDNKQFNVYDLQPGDFVIILVSINVLWENMYNTISYNLHVDEIVKITN